MHHDIVTTPPLDWDICHFACCTHEARFLDELDIFIINQKAQPR
jgi:hypothetical protein